MIDAERTFDRRRGCRSRKGRHYRQFLEVDPAFLEHDRKPEPALLVLEEQTLAMCSRKAAAQRCRLGNGEDRRMRIRPMRDPERIEVRKQLDRKSVV